MSASGPSGPLVVIFHGWGGGGVRTPVPISGSAHAIHVTMSTCSVPYSDYPLLMHITETDPIPDNQLIVPWFTMFS